MHQGPSNYPKFQIHEKALSANEVVCWPRKLTGTRKRGQSLFSLLLEIESQLRTEGRNDQIEQRKHPKEKIASDGVSKISLAIASSRYPSYPSDPGHKSQFPFEAHPQHR
jgi:hypothetical protein